MIYLHVCVPHEYINHGGQKRVSGPLELDFLVAMNHQVAPVEEKKPAFQLLL